MSNLEKPLYSLTIGEYIELNQKMISDQVEKKIGDLDQEKVQKTEDIIFVDDVVKLTGYKKSTIYSKVCKYEFPVLSRRKPLSFSKKAIVSWIQDGKPSLLSQESSNHLKSKI